MQSILVVIVLQTVQARFLFSDMDDLSLPDFSCSYCNFRPEHDDIHQIIDHGVLAHKNNDLKIRSKILDDKNGEFVYQSLYLRPASIKTFNCLYNKLNSGFKYVVDLGGNQIGFKRTERVETESNIDDDQSRCVEMVKSNDDDEIKNTVVNVLRMIDETGRGDDFVSALKSIESGTLPVNNLSLQLFLDIGKFLKSPTINTVRYSQISLNFWTLVHKLFKGKAIRLFRGVMTQL